MKIMITGSNGLLGQKIVDNHLSTPTNFDLIATSVGPNRHPITTGYSYAPLDITDGAAVMSFLKLHQPDVVINTAAMTNVDQCEKEREACRKLNVDAVAHLIAGCRAVDAHLVHLSTDFIFDGKSGPYKEEDAPNPLSFYGQSKWDAEKLLAQSGISYAILRTVLVYGVSHQMSRSNIVLWVRDSLMQGKPLRVVNDQFRTPTLAEDLAKACIAAALKKAQGVYHISGAELMSIIDLVMRVADFFKLDTSNITSSTSADLGQPANRPPKTGFIIDKARRELGFQPTPFEDGLALVERQLAGGI
jgi:dTDP-4-dehydrorhamnose reductase